MNIPTTDAAVMALMKEKAPYPTRRMTRIIPGIGPVYGLRIRTPGWSYFLTKFKDGWEIYPPNTSANYAVMVDQLIECLLEVQAR
jgi:hypothetical protein